MCVFGKSQMEICSLFPLCNYQSFPRVLTLLPPQHPQPSFFHAVLIAAVPWQAPKPGTFCNDYVTNCWAFIHVGHLLPGLLVVFSCLAVSWDQRWLLLCSMSNLVNMQPFIFRAHSRTMAGVYWATRMDSKHQIYICSFSVSSSQCVWMHLGLRHCGEQVMQQTRCFIILGTF